MQIYVRVGGPCQVQNEGFGHKARYAQSVNIGGNGHFCSGIAENHHGHEQRLSLEA
jgi:hypothetical protein